MSRRSVVAAGLTVCILLLAPQSALAAPSTTQPEPPSTLKVRWGDRPGHLPADRELRYFLDAKAVGQAGPIKQAADDFNRLGYVVRVSRTTVRSQANFVISVRGTVFGWELPNFEKRGIKNPKVSCVNGASTVRSASMSPDEKKRVAALYLGTGCTKLGARLTFASALASALLPPSSKRVKGKCALLSDRIVTVRGKSYPKSCPSFTAKGGVFKAADKRLLAPAYAKNRAPFAYLKITADICTGEPMLFEGNAVYVKLAGNMDGMGGNPEGRLMCTLTPIDRSYDPDLRVPSWTERNVAHPFKSITLDWGRTDLQPTTWAAANPFETTDWGRAFIQPAPRTGWAAGEYPVTETVCDFYDACSSHTIRLIVTPSA